MTQLASQEPIQLTNSNFSPTATKLEIGSGLILLTCDHASNHGPEQLKDLSLRRDHLDNHISWDIRASALTHSLSKHLNGPAILANFSRLVINANRALNGFDLVPLNSDGVATSSNSDLSCKKLTARSDNFHRPFHDSVATLIETRRGHAPITAMVAILSFTSQLSTQKSQIRPWHVGRLFHRDKRLADAIATQCRNESDLVIGLNEPYAPTDGGYRTTHRHATNQNMLKLLIKVRNDLLRTGQDLELWAQRLARWMTNALKFLWACDPDTNKKMGLLTQ
jgi:predicted N-formylglutamate amidohydrolase